MVNLHIRTNIKVFFFMVRQRLVGLDLLIFRFHDHIHTLQSVGLLCKSQRTVAETSNWQHTSSTRYWHLFPGRFRTRNSSKGAAADPLLRPHGYLDQSVSRQFSDKSNSLTGKAAIFFQMGNISFTTLSWRSATNNTSRHATTRKTPNSSKRVWSREEAKK